VLHEFQALFRVSKCVEYFYINFTNNALRFDEFVVIKLSFNIAVKLSLITSFL